MKFLLLSFLVSFITTFLVVWFSKKKPVLIEDSIHRGVQSFHIQPTSRLGGLGVFFGLIPMLLLGYTFNSAYIYFVLSAFIVYLIGFVEDMSGILKPKFRLMLIMLSTGIAYFFLDVRIVRVDVPFIDNILSIQAVSFLFSIFAMAGLANAINIIDGFNGLSSIVSAAILLAIAYVAYRVGDSFIFYAGIAAVLSILGFFVFNYPFGLVFLGDGGAYLLGFIIAMLSILLVKNHSEVSAWFVLLVSIYPVYETIFTIYRRKFLRKQSPFLPDAFHLHTLFYRIVLKKMFKINNPTLRNSATSPMLWLVNMLGVVPAILFYNKTIVLVLFILIFILIYTRVYFAVIGMRLPKDVETFKEVSYEYYRHQ